MAEELNKCSPSATADDGALGRGRTRRKKRSLWPSFPRWVPTSTEHMIAAEKRLLSLVKTPYTQEQVRIGCSPAGSRKKRQRRRRRFKPATRRNGISEEEEGGGGGGEEMFINTITFNGNNNEESSRGEEEGTPTPTPTPTLVMLHGYGASIGLFFRNFDSLANHFTVIAIDQLGWGRSSRPKVTCKNTEESDAWFIDSFEEWRKAKNLTNFILLGHSLGGYVAAKYALHHPEHVKHLILVGPVGFTYDDRPFESSFKETILEYLWESNSRITQHNLIRALGPFGPRMVRKCIGDEIGGNVLNEEESDCFADYVYHICAAKRPSGERCSKHLFSMQGFARTPLLLDCRTREWRVSTTFIYGIDDDEFNDQIAREASKKIKVDCEIIRISKGGHLVLMENADGFHSAVVYGCRRFLNLGEDYSLPPGLNLVTPN